MEGWGGVVSGSGTPQDAQYTVLFNDTRGIAGPLQTAFERARQRQGKISKEALELKGWSGVMYRRLINTLLELIEEPRYLEIGVFTGSSLCAALDGNSIDAMAIDNWSQFKGPYQEFYKNLANFKGNNRVSFLERDFRSVDYKHLGPFNVYFFDGPHKEQDQYDGVTYTLPALADNFVLIVDDWNKTNVRRGTFRAIADNGLEADFAVQVFTTLDNTHAHPYGERSDWHNGYMLAALRKKKA